MSKGVGPASGPPPRHAGPQALPLQKGSEFLSSPLSGDEDSLSSKVLFSHRQDMVLGESIFSDILFFDVQFGHTHSMGPYLILGVILAFSSAPGESGVVGESTIVAANT